MKFYFAPLEGITGYIYRNAFDGQFGKADKYFTPFLAPSGKKALNARERADIATEHNEGMYVVPQILTKYAEDFVNACKELREYGYREVNLNLGCPSGTVVNKGRGAGFLADKDALKKFLDEIFSKADMDISIKTRIGMESLQEWEALLRIYNEFPMKELIVHPRLRTDYYQGTPHLEAFEYAMANTKNKLCYNGDIVTIEDYLSVKERFPDLESVMLGRGFLRNPFLLMQLRELDREEITGEGKVQNEGALNIRENLKRFKVFHDELLKGYGEYMSGDTPVLFKMKELWFYMQDLFPNDEKLYKKIKKTKNLREYESVVRGLF